ncbi:MAG TPA: hypothetical protein PLU17_03480 [Chitinophagaceae bacterium]|nr:hypothetical protein [Chitinophagaceae bacterium]
MYKYLLIAMITFLGFSQLKAQKDRKINFVGTARSLMNSNYLSVRDSIPDTASVKRNDGGYALVDLGVNIKPNKNTEILGMFRIRNEFGGFWGSGVSFDVRQLWVKGVVANALRYQLGDLNLKQTPFTLFNHHADQIDSMPEVFNLQRNIVSYERFYMNNNTWRMQGANVDFGLSFSKYLKEINVNAFLTRVNATNFTSVPDRLMSGYTIQFVQSKNLQLSFNSNHIFDVKGTVANDNLFKSSVNTIDWKLKRDLARKSFLFGGEIGQSHYQYTNDTLAPDLKDYFVHAYAQMSIPKWNLTGTIGYLNVGPDFRSIGAQSKDINYNAVPVYFDRYTNDQRIRPITLFDVVGNENIYNRTITTSLMSENQLFNQVLPYGISTFNRVGGYAKIQYKNKKGIDITSQYYKLNEIRGQGSFALRDMSIFKLNASVSINQLIKTKKLIALQVGTMMQTTNRSSDQSIENMDLKSNQYTLGFRWELFSNFELMLGYILQQNDGHDYLPTRNGYTEITYFNRSDYQVKQELAAAGIRYNFSSKTYLCVLYQQSKFTDKLNISPGFSINQFGIIYNITL